MATNTSRRAPSGILTLLWALFFFFVFALLITLWVRCSGTSTDTVRDQRAAERASKRSELDKADNDLLNGAGVLDQAKGTAHIPLSEAKKLTLAELQGKKVTPSQLKIEPRLPMPPPHDPNSTEPPPMALPSAPQGADTMHFDAQLVEAPAAADATTPELEKSGGNPGTPASQVPQGGATPASPQPAPSAPAASPSAPSAEANPSSAPATPTPAPAEPQAGIHDASTADATFVSVPSALPQMPSQLALLLPPAALSLSK
jgi:hypothetical protein